MYIKMRKKEREQDAYILDVSSKEKRRKKRGGGKTKEEAEGEESWST